MARYSSKFYLFAGLAVAVVLVLSAAGLYFIFGSTHADNPAKNATTPASQSAQTSEASSPTGTTGQWNTSEISPQSTISGDQTSSSASSPVSTESTPSLSNSSGTDYTDGPSPQSTAPDNETSSSSPSSVSVESTTGLSNSSGTDYADGPSPQSTAPDNETSSSSPSSVSVESITGMSNSSGTDYADGPSPQSTAPDNETSSSSPSSVSTESATGPSNSSETHSTDGPSPRSTVAGKQTFSSSPPSVSSESTTSQLERQGLGSTDTSGSKGKETKICGKRSLQVESVVDGTNASIGGWPWQAALMRNAVPYPGFICGAVLINEYWALTAAHCVESFCKHISRDESCEDEDSYSLRLRLGDHNLSINDTETHPRFKYKEIGEIVPHPDYEGETRENDLALLELKEPLEHEDNIIPICLPADPVRFDNLTAFVTGWGNLDREGAARSALQVVPMRIIKNSACKKMYRNSHSEYVVSDQSICAAYREGESNACLPNDGGPMVIQRADGRWVLVGVTSFSAGCKKRDQPALFTRISAFKKWILSRDE